MARSALFVVNFFILPSFLSIFTKLLPLPSFKMETSISEQVTKLLQRLNEAERRAKLLKLEIKDIRTQIAALTASTTSILNHSRTDGLSSLGVLRASENSISVPSTSKRKVTTETDSGQNKKPKANFTIENDYVVVFTDGACENNGKITAKAGIGVWFGDGHHLNISKPVNGRATNNTAEIQAACEALNVLKDQGIEKVKIFTDSQFLINCITNWINKWKCNNWRVATGAPVKNKEDLVKLDDLIQTFSDVKWEYVPGHKGIRGNEQADQLARTGALRYKP